MFSIVIPSLNEWYYLNLTLDSIYNYSDNDLLKEIIIVDDYSEKEDYSFLEKHPLKDKIKLIKNKTRKGPSYSRNIWAKNASWEVLIFLDAHMYCYDLDLIKLKSLRYYINKWAVQGTVWDLSNKEIKWQIYKIKDYLLESTWDIVNEDIAETPAIAWWFTIISKKIFDKVWWFNKKFNSWGSEDIELSFRLWTYGYDLFYTNQVWVAHYFKQKFNYEVKSENVLYNKYIIYKIYFEKGYYKSCMLINAFEKQYWKEMLKGIIWSIENDEKLMIFIDKYKKKQKRTIDEYFNKFNKYYEEL